MGGKYQQPFLPCRDFPRCPSHPLLENCQGHLVQLASPPGMATRVRKHRGAAEMGREGRHPLPMPSSLEQNQHPVCGRSPLTWVYEGLSGLPIHTTKTAGRHHTL